MPGARQCTLRVAGVLLCERQQRSLQLLMLTRTLAAAIAPQQHLA